MIIFEYTGIAAVVIVLAYLILAGISARSYIKGMNPTEKKKNK